MSPDERRRERRLDVDISAALFHGERVVACRVLNMCSKGFLIESHRQLPVGEAVHLTVPLYPARMIHCIVQIRHVNAERLGALITEISVEDQAVCAKFLAERKQARDTQTLYA
jgi:hypothetical protein